MSSQKYLLALVGVLLFVALSSKAQDYDDDNYSNQGNNQGDGENYGNNDDGYSNNQPNYQQNVDSEGSNNNPSNYSPQSGSDADSDYDGEDSSAAASSPQPSFTRLKRSIGPAEIETAKVSESAPKLRVKRHGKYYIGPVYTYVKTDKHANFKWGVKHKVGKKHYG